MNTDLRESILRYSSFLDYKDQMTKDPKGMPKNFGASKPEEIRNLKNIDDRAFWLSNDLLGAYDRISVTGGFIRQHLFPFWSWKELNMKRYVQFLKNASEDGKLMETIGRKTAGLAIRSPLIAANVGRFVLKAGGLVGLMSAYNYLVFPQEERELSDDIRKTPHIVLGRGLDGKVAYFNRIGALSDILDWFGLNSIPKNIEQWVGGKKPLIDILKDQAAESIKAPLNTVVQGVMPFGKTAFELMSRRALFPDITKPSTIRDRYQHLANSLGLGDEYQALAGKPSEGYARSLPKLLMYQDDPGQIAYRDVFDLKNKFLDKMGMGAEGFWLTPRGDAAYNIKLALRYGDRDALQKYLVKYATLGGTAEGLQASLKMMNPLGGLNQAMAPAFVASLDADGKEKLARAMKFYAETLLGTKPLQKKAPPSSIPGVRRQ
jgi:hypothetical protein